MHVFLGIAGEYFFTNGLDDEWVIATNPYIDDFEAFGHTGFLSRA